MKKIILLLSFTFFVQAIMAQKISGQWRGFFNSNGDIVTTGGDNTEYVLELDINGSVISGYSYTYFEHRKYYVICSISGTFYKNTKSMKVYEVAKIKGLTPPGWIDCLQTHILTYSKNDKIEILAGKWGTAPGQTSDCGYGNTTLNRRTLTKDLAFSNTPKSSKSIASNDKKKATISDLSDRNKRSAPPTPPIANVNKPVTAPPANPKAPLDIAITKPIEKEPTKKATAPPVIKPIEAPNSIVNFEKRNADILKTIEIKNETFKVDLYDNGEIDGDSISLFYNGKLLLSHKRLSDKPLSITLDATTNHEINELNMYAENLGSIPPNTAVMVITDGDNRYEVRIASDLKKSGTIRFIHKPQTQ